MDGNTKIIIDCNQAGCLARGIGHDNWWSEDEDDRNSVFHEHWRSGPLMVRRDSWDEGGWYLYMHDLDSPDFTATEAREFAADVVHAAHLVETLNSN